MRGRDTQVERLRAHAGRREEQARADVARARVRLAAERDERIAAEDEAGRRREEAVTAEAELYAQLTGETFDAAELDVIEGRLIEIDQRLDAAAAALTSARKREEAAAAAAVEAATVWRQRQRKRDTWTEVAHRLRRQSARAESFRAEAELDELAGMASATTVVDR